MEAKNTQREEIEKAEAKKMEEKLEKTRWVDGTPTTEVTLVTIW